MPATMETAPPRTPAAQRDAFRPINCNKPPPVGWLGTLIETQPPSPPAELEVHEMDVREMSAAPSIAIAPPDAAAEQKKQAAEFMATDDVDAAEIRINAPLPPTDALNAEMAESCEETKAMRAMHPPLKVTDTDVQTMLVNVGAGKFVRETAAPAATDALVTVKEETRSCAYGDAFSTE